MDAPTDLDMDGRPSEQEVAAPEEAATPAAPHIPVEQVFRLSPNMQQVVRSLLVSTELPAPLVLESSELICRLHIACNGLPEGLSED